MKRMLSVLLAVLLTLGMFAVANAEEDQKFVIGMSQCNLGEPWRVAMNDQISAAAADYPMLEVIFADAAQDNSKQIADIENFIQMGVDLIIASPNEAKPLTNVVKQAYEAGIPVILLDRKIEGDTYTQWIGADNVFIGKVCGEYVADVLLPDGGKICEIKGLEGTSAGIERNQGFNEGIAKNPKIEVVAVNNAVGDRFGHGRFYINQLLHRRVQTGDEGCHRRAGKRLVYTAAFQCQLHFVYSFHYCFPPCSITASLSSPASFITLRICDDIFTTRRLPPSSCISA